jgi:hypothetical protein
MGFATIGNAASTMVLAWRGNPQHIGRAADAASGVSFPAARHHHHQFLF